MDIVRIPLSQGKFALIDAEDYELVAAFKWCAWRSRQNATWYATRSTYGPLRRDGGIPKRGMIYMHRLIAGAPNGIEVDHRNLDGLDNRRSNLRLATRPQNGANLPQRIDNTSGFIGVTWDKSRHLWQARVRLNGITHHFGRFATAEEAARVRDQEAKRLHGPFVRLNFPDDS